MIRANGVGDEASPGPFTILGSAAVNARVVEGHRDQAVRVDAKVDDLVHGDARAVAADQVERARVSRDHVPVVDGHPVPLGEVAAGQNPVPVVKEVVWNTAVCAIAVSMPGSPVHGLVTACGASNSEMSRYCWVVVTVPRPPASASVAPAVSRANAAA